MSLGESTVRTVTVGDIHFANDRPLVLISGPCQIESREHAFMMADGLKAATAKAGVPFIFKASYDKANRTSVSGKRGIGIEEGLRILADIRDAFGCPVLTDIHTEEQARAAGEVVDILQIPAFLSRQTDLLVAAGRTGKAINVKKGQFLAPWDMKNVIAKIESTGNTRILACERGTSFGYNALVSDMRSLPIMAATGYPVVFDATHSVQEPGGKGDSTGGNREHVAILSRAAVAVGVAAVFAEAHDDPDHAPSDGPNMLRLDAVPAYLDQLKRIDEIAKSILKGAA
ncbi:MAG: 3-deoxy-8-phosphooctulonate synthase [Rhizobiaceae bacterium]